MTGERMEVGDWLREAREAHGWKQEDLEEASGVLQETISRIERGETKRPRPHTLHALERALGRTFARPELAPRPLSAREELAGYLERVPYEIEVFDAPEAAAAMGEGREPVGYLPIPAHVRPARRKLYGVRVAGTSMTPRFEPGDVLVIDPDREPQPGNDVIAMRDGALVFKRLERDDSGELVLAGNNGTTPAADASIRGVVVYMTREML